MFAALVMESSKDGFGLVHFSVQSNHLHLICEASSHADLSVDLRALAIRVAQSLNRTWKRRGRVFANRYHDRVLRTPREVRNALAYVLNNARHHGIELPRDTPDPCSSGRWFTDWAGQLGPLDADNPLPRPQTWLLRVGWLHHGPIRFDETPGERSSS